MKKIFFTFFLLVISINIFSFSGFYIDTSGKRIDKQTYQNGLFFSEGLAPIMLDGKWGYINRMGKIVIKPKYILALPFSEGLACIKSNQTAKCDYIDKNDKVVLSSVSEYFDLDVQSYHDGLVGFRSGNKFGFKDKHGKIVISPQYASVGKFSTGLAMVENEEHKFGFINLLGEYIIPAIFKKASSFSEGVAYVTYDNNSQAYIDVTGKKFLTVKSNCKGGDSFSDGLVQFTKSGKTGFMDFNGKIVIKNLYENSANDLFNDGIAPVRFVIKENNMVFYKYGFINRKGELIIKPIYDFATIFSEGLAFVGVEGDE